MSKYPYLLVAALAAGALRPLPAQQAPSPPAGQPITFDDAIAIALKQNIAVRQAANAADLSDATVKQQKLQLLPDLRLSVSGADNVGRNFSQSDGAIVNQQTQSLSSGLSTSLTLFDGGRTRSSINAAEATSDASDKDLTRAKQTAVFTVASDYVTLANQQEQLRVQQENLTAQQAQEKLIKQLVDAGTRPVSDLYQQQATVASAQLAVTQANTNVELAKVDLIQALQLDPAGTYDFVAPKVAVTDTSRTYSLDSLMATAYASRADLGAEAARVDASQQSVKAAAASKLPSISVTGSYSSAYSSAADLGIADQLNQRRGGSIGLGISIPIFDRGAASIAEQRAQIDADNEKLALDNEKQTIALEVRRAYLGQQSAKDQLTAAQAQLDAATQAVSMTQARYQAGAATLVEVTQARAQYVQAASAAATAKNNLVLQQAAMQYYTGQLDPEHASLGD
ncbi:MAG TPA: TolC family protein [Gemmatimonadaceae bacterium]|nr:TolC family protein [Gemmatimonadaceae bacterium]